MTIPVVYKSTDGNAPVLCGTRTSMVNVLRKILVDGYGDKPGAGWSMPYINYNLTDACFRNNPASGTGFWLRADGASTTGANTVILSGYEDMTVEPELAGFFRFGSYWWSNVISSTVDGVARPWICIATDTWLYFFSHRNVTVFPTSQKVRDDYTNSVGINFFFGDFDKIAPDDAFNCAFFLSYAGQQQSFGFAKGANDALSSDHYIARSSTGATGVINCAVSLSPPGPVDSCFGGKGAPYDGISALLASRLYINNGSANTIRGFLPNAVAPLHSFPFENHAIVSAPDGYDYLVISFRAYFGAWGVGTSSQILINIGPTP